VTGGYFVRHHRRADEEEKRARRSGQPSDEYATGRGFSRDVGIDARDVAPTGSP
jgi:hypothetical protein